jgi:hypothetical protein
MSQRPSRRALSVWTILQVAGIVAWIGGFVVAFYFVQTYSKPSQVAQANAGQVAGLVLTGLAFLLIIFSMVKHSPDGRS